jgi:predicted transcriptional regulator
MISPPRPPKLRWLTRPLPIRRHHLTWFAIACVPAVGVTTLNRLVNPDWRGHGVSCIFALMLAAWWVVPCNDSKYGQGRPFHYVRQTVIGASILLVLFIDFML